MLAIYGVENQKYLVLLTISSLNELDIVIQDALVFLNILVD